MNDRQLEALVRMALEAERLEASAPPASAVAAGRWRLAWLGAGLAAAAAVAIAFIVVFPRAPSPIAIVPVDRPAVAGAIPEQSVVFAIFREADGECSCIQTHEPEWEGGRRLADVGRSELLDVVFRDPCTTALQHVLVVAVSGKAGTVPATSADAERLAAALPEEPLADADLSSLAYDAMPDLPPGSTVVARSVSFVR